MALDRGNLAIGMLYFISMVKEDLLKEVTSELTPEYEKPTACRDLGESTPMGERKVSKFKGLEV